MIHILILALVTGCSDGGTGDSQAPASSTVAASSSETATTVAAGTAVQGALVSRSGDTCYYRVPAITGLIPVYAGTLACPAGLLLDLDAPARV